MSPHIAWMQRALEEALAAGAAGEAPIAALVVRQGELLSVGRNTKTSQRCGFAHAELNALLRAADKLGRHPSDAVLYSTLEPCAMCLGAAVFAGIRTVVYGAEDSQGGATRMFQDDPIYSRWLPVMIGGVLRDECETLLASVPPTAQDRHTQRPRREDIPCG